jgi:hypothetical protein
LKILTKSISQDSVTEKEKIKSLFFNNLLKKY